MEKWLKDYKSPEDLLGQNGLLKELTLLSLIIYLPFLQSAFGTYSLSVADWTLVAGLALTIVPILELGKWMVRRGWLGPAS